MPTTRVMIANAGARPTLPRWLALASMALAIFISACSADLREGAYACAADSVGVCPPDWLCECRGARCEWLCYSNAQGSCGDEVLSPGEECDGEAISTQHRCASGFSHCLADCTVACTRCGDGKVESTPTGSEACDDDNLLSHDGCSSTCQLEEPAWRQLSSHGGEQPVGASSAMAYDAARGRLVMFGGGDPLRETPVYYNDTWEWDGRGWLLVSTGRGPSARSDHAMAYDAARRKVILFGGYNRGAFDSAIWEWDGVRWQRITAASPGPQWAGRTLAYDARRGRLVLFVSSVEGETWEWDGGQRTWTKFSAATSTPGPLGASGMTYDPARGKVVLYGSSETLSGMWEWDGIAWSFLEPANTPPSLGAVEAMFYDLAQKKVVVVISVSEIWTWDGVARLWARASVPSTLPFPRSKFTMAYFPPAQSSVLFGGMEVTDTWSWNGTLWSRAATPYSTPASGGPLAYDPTQARSILVQSGATTETWEWKAQGWRQLVSTGANPGAFASRDVAFDPRRQRLLGFRSPNEAWEWNGTQWARVADPPVALLYSTVLYDPVDRRTHVFGGGAGTSQVRWDGAQWQLGAQFNGLRLGAAFSVDPLRNRTVLFSGFDGAFVREETWELSGRTWSQQTPGQSPNASEYGMMVFDAGRRRSILIAGGVWEWDGQDWSDITPLTPTPSVSNLTYDASRQAVIGAGYRGAVWTLRYESQTPDEGCHSGFDVDRDGLVGCADPDCWGYCSPFCSPGQTCDAADPRCGDGTCNAALETCQACPSDCGVCPSVCGDYACTAGESATNCPGDCP